MFRRRGVQLALAMTVFGYAGVFTCLTYIAPLLTEVTGFSGQAVSVLLTLFGVGALVGNLVAGRLADRAPMTSLAGVLAALAVVLLLFPLAAGSKVAAVVAVVAFGVTAFATVPGLQSRVIAQAEGAPTLAASTNISAFQLANALGAAIGGWIVSDFGLTRTGPVGALLALVGLLITGYAIAHDRRVARTTGQGGPTEQVSQPVGA